MTIPMPLVQTRDNVMTITLNRPEKLNALTPEIYAFIGERVTQASADPACRAIVLRGNGRAFSAGFDLTLEMGDRTHEERLHSLHEIANRARWAVWRCKKPVIAAIHGYCMGGAFELVLPCDFTIAAESCRLGEPEILFGEGPAFMMVPWLVNHKIAKDILLTGRQFTAAEALRMGIVSAVVADDALDAAVESLTQTLCRLPPSAVTINKVGINRAYEAQGMAAHIDSWVEAAAYLSFMDDEARSEFQRRVMQEGPSAGIAWRTQYYAGGKASERT
ncbi:short chain enoyl-CoA hydratase [Caballeronia calidae]|uniref:Short chain enoyl-CoA hydratase n=1 Tax=Caballeronia calidae TaxID=1777139 RepID=A0A158EEP3_9BURK|nr:enoyl-CoA hydratase/isomerase family protein [Caballeronia calidae]SAL04357.1 short chain enoyl-CoA hydratase [Caballeronia calidae]